MTKETFQDRLYFVSHVDSVEITNPILQELVEEGCIEAEPMLAQRYLRGEGFAPDTDKALELLLHALTEGGFWQGLAAFLADNNVSAFPGYDALYATIQEKAESGNANCLFFFGLLAEHALNFAEAAVYYGQAAGQKHTDALYRLGLLHFHTGLYAEAFECFQKASDLGLYEASFPIGFCYEQGLGTAQDYEKAFDCLNPGYGDPLAHYHLAILYENGLGTDVDPKQAAFNYNEFLTNDPEDNIVPLGRLESVEEITEDMQLRAMLGMGKALRQLPYSDRDPWYRTPMEYFEEVIDTASADQELANEALYQLGQMLYFSIETMLDRSRGRELIEQAAHNGHAAAAELMTRILEIESETAPAEDVPSTEERRKEALLRLWILEQKGVASEVRAAFAENGIPGYATDDVYGFEPFTETSDGSYTAICQAISDLERQDKTVYFVHSNLTMSYGQQASLFFVSSSPSEWVQDRMDLLHEAPIVAVANLRDDYTEIGSIRFNLENNLMERLN